MALIEQVGAYAGLAAFLGFAVLAALHISQARDLRQLRKRESEPRSQVGPEPTASAPSPDEESEHPDTEMAEQANAPPESALTHTGTPAPTQPQTETQPQTQSSTVVDANSTTEGPAVGDGPPSHQAATAAATRQPLLRRTRVVALLRLGGALVFAAVVALAVVALVTSGGGHKPVSGTPAGTPPISVVRPLDPASITVSVLNASSQPGVANRFSQQVRQQGFRVDRVANAGVSNLSDSIVMYVPDAQPAASLVAQRLQIARVQPADGPALDRAGPVQVVVLVGTDKVGAGT